MTKETAVDKIRKLLRLARNNTNEHEAMSALAAAQRLMLQHNIDSVEEVAESIAVAGDWHEMEIKRKWQVVIYNAVASLYNCRMVYSKVTGRVQFIGKPSNVLVCADTAVWVREQVDALHKQGLAVFREQMGGKLSKFQYRDFRLTFKEACAMRIWARVNEINAAVRKDIPAHMALVVVDQALAAADEIMKAMHVKTSKTKLRQPGFGSKAGRVAGDAVRLQHAAGDKS